MRLDRGRQELGSAPAKHTEQVGSGLRFRIDRSQCDRFRWGEKG